MPVVQVSSQYVHSHQMFYFFFQKKTLLELTAFDLDWCTEFPLPQFGIQPMRDPVFALPGGETLLCKRQVFWTLHIWKHLYTTLILEQKFVYTIGINVTNNEKVPLYHLLFSSMLRRHETTQIPDVCLMYFCVGWSGCHLLGNPSCWHH